MNLLSIEPQLVGEYVGPVIVALIYIVAVSLLNEPQRRQFNAIVVAGAGAAYLRGGLGLGELIFTALVTYIAYRGLHDYRLIALAWLLHTGWDVAHHLSGNPIIPFLSTSSFGCAICDPVIALWCFAGGPSLITRWRRVGVE
ncbi:MAG: DUF6010 family protein [Caldilineaceae bacterium]